MMYFLTMLFLAQGVRQRPAPMDRPAKYNIVEALNLDEKQEKEWNKIEISFEREIITLRNKMQGSMIDLKEMLLSDNPDINKIQKKMEEIEKIKYQMGLKRIEKQIKLYKLLNKEQREQFLPFLLGHRMHGGQAKQGMPGMHGRMMH